MRAKKQRELNFKTWGGKRIGAGRKRAPGRKSCVAHRRRAKHVSRNPLHVTLRLRADVPNVRTRDCYLQIEQAIRAGKDRFGFRAVEFSVQGNHLHMVVEAENDLALRRGMQGLAIRIARAINRALHRTGKVFADRFHARDLSTPTDVRNALLYVLNNAKHHSRRRWARLEVDPFSSAKWFDGWGGPVDCARLSTTRPGAHPKTWLLEKGWRWLGLLSPSEVPR